MSHEMEGIPIGATVLSDTQESTVKQVRKIFDFANRSTAKENNGYNINVTVTKYRTLNSY